ncbi:copper chaperone PCu(A)C [Arsenicicoccus sp. oral taxon 190]|uniref:copper chaperone PCu(A)C n=1 Tax=Arsenicicoccus sp. oral taxon 190 TaxID=1658671 RepID=UPI000679FAB3|nr:copper chaperone PCu(A)C [Arsenicicoccus sp. oral taxon 190]AKT50694.1 hypothetical protein ADJ73_04110 [Arsenicicoccus sp. oral taxon 190]
MTTRLALPCALALVALTTAACGSGATTTATTSTTTSTTAATAGTSTSSAVDHHLLTVKDPWIKAVKGGMTGMFATLVNDTDKPVTIVAAESDVATSVQLHVTEKDASGAMVMKETKQGFTVPAHGTVELRPGGNHVMLMGLRKPILSGTSTTVTLTDAKGGHVHIEAPGREFNGAKETYGGMSMTPNAPATPAASTTAHGH